MHAHICHNMDIETRGQIGEDSSLLPPRGFRLKSSSIRPRLLSHRPSLSAHSAELLPVLFVDGDWLSLLANTDSNPSLCDCQYIEII